MSPPATAGLPGKRRAADASLLRPALPRPRDDRAAGRRPRQQARPLPGNWIPHKLRRATKGGVFFVGDSAGHCLPLTAEGIRTALYFGVALGRELRDVYEGGQDRDRAASRYTEFHASHEWKFGWMLRVQRLVPRIPPRLLGPMIRLLGSKRFVDWSFEHYLQIAPPPPSRTTRRCRPSAGRADDPRGAERDLVEAEQA